MAIDWSAMNPQGETTLTEFDHFATVRLSDGESVDVTGDGRLSVDLANGETIDLPPIDVLVDMFRNDRSEYAFPRR